MITVLHCVSNMDRAGIETMLMNYYRNIDKDKVQFYFLCNKKKPGAYDEEIKSMGGKIFYTPGLNPLQWFKYQKVVKEIIIDNNIDIVHVHNGAFGYQALLAAKKVGIKVRICHVHGTKIDFNLKLPLKLIYKTQLKMVANYYWGCGLEAVTFYFGKKVIKSKNYTLLTNAIDEQKFKFSESLRRKIRDYYNIDDDKIVIGHVGRFMKQKNHKFLIKLFEQLLKKNKKYVLLLIGDGELQEKIKKEIVMKNLTDSVILTGNIPNVNECYNAMDLFILPSLFEGLPVVGIEAQANGLNCIFSDSISKEVDITSNVDFLSLNDSLCTWINEVEKLSTKKRNKITDEIKNNNYSIKEEAKKLENKYLKILKKGEGD